MSEYIKTPPHYFDASIAVYKLQDCLEYLRKEGASEENIEKEIEKLREDLYSKCQREIDYHKNLWDRILNFEI